MKFKLQKKDFEFIMEIVDSLPKDLNYIIGDQFNITFEADSKTTEELLDKLSDVLADEGFDDEDNLTSKGVRLERIIDSISEVFYD